MKHRASFFALALLLAPSACDDGSTGGLEDSTTGSGGAGGAGGGSGGGDSGGDGNGNDGNEGNSGGDGGSPSTTYPDGPYGFNEGSTIESLTFPVIINPELTAQTTVEIPLSVFYNPTGTGSYPLNSPFGAGALKPEALILTASATWSAPDTTLALTTYPPEYTLYQPQGLEILNVLVDGATEGVPATEPELQAWISGGTIQYPTGIDPEEHLRNEAEIFPMLILIDTSTMEIVDVRTGIPDALYWTEVVAPLVVDP